MLLDHPDAQFSFDVPRGYQESTILAAVVTKADLEPKADKCTKVSLLLLYQMAVVGFEGLSDRLLLKSCFVVHCRFTFGTLEQKTRNYWTSKAKCRYQIGRWKFSFASLTNGERRTTDAMFFPSLVARYLFFN